MLKFKWETGFRQTEIGKMPNPLSTIDGEIDPVYALNNSLRIPLLHPEILPPEWCYHH
jgi:hypothetical protein